MVELVGLSECVLLPAREALRLGIAVTGLPAEAELRECCVPSDFAAFLQSVLMAMFTGAAERAQSCRVHIEVAWDDASIEISFADDGGPFYNVSESPAALELSRLRAMIMEDGGSLEWSRVGGPGPWHNMCLSLPIPPF